MAGPGCGARHEWLQHPREFPYFCDGSAEVEKARWRKWGAAKATATAIFNEAVLNSHNSVATAPRRRTPVRIVASQIKVCGGRHAYTRIVITYEPAVNGIKKLREASYLPQCSLPGGLDTTHLERFLSPDRKVWCGFDLNQITCGTRPEPPTYSATLHASGRVEICSVPRLEYPAGSQGPPLGCFQQWPPTYEHVPVLAYGKRTTFGGFGCAAATDGVTCTKLSGADEGRGFRVNKEEAVEVGGRRERPRPAAARAKASGASCGSVTNQGIKVQLKVTKGSPPCASVRATAKRYGNPISKSPRYYCGRPAYECQYSLYPNRWRCGGLFMGSFFCWRGSNDPQRAGEEFEGTQAF